MSEYSSLPEPESVADEEARLLRERNRKKTVNLIIGSMAVSTVFMLGLAVYFYLTGVETVAYVLVAFAVLMVPFLFWFRKQLLSGAIKTDGYGGA